MWNLGWEVVAKIVEFPFKNALNHKINEITVDMLEAIVATQSSQRFFHEIVNRASHLFQHLQLVDASLWFDFIKVYVGLANNEIMLMRIDETDRPTSKNNGWGVGGPRMA